jgi:glycogen operon protein
MTDRMISAPKEAIAGGVRPGTALPLGATVTRRGVQFSLFSRHGSGVRLCLFDGAQDAYPSRVIELDPSRHKTGDIWHVHVKGLEPGQLYLYRVSGPWEPKRGHRFDEHRYLVDPYSRAMTGGFEWRLPTGARASSGGDGEEPSAAAFPKCIVCEDRFDWQGDRPLNYPLRKSIIYETHVRGMTKHPSAEVTHPGTYRGVIEMIPYLVELGVTALELLPVQEFNEHELDTENPETGEALVNYWGYNTLAFFAPKAGYAADGSSGEQVDEFKEMVRELHRAGIEVILDIVFNHTGEGHEEGPTFSFRGLDNSVYYILEEDRRYYRDFTGCGNTVNCNHPIVQSFILDCLHYWVTEMHVDGFRFDLASILGRDRNGKLLENPPVLERIAEDPVLRHTKLIAEAWDAGGAYQVGSFPGGRWAEWNDRFRDDVRRFWRGDKGMAAAFATRVTGSSDLYLRDGRKPFHSINLITCHDGFTLRDLVSYTKKHNEPNGEDNRDGHDANFSAGYGAEGDSSNRSILHTRRRQMKNFMTTLFLSLGTPMLLGGDEFGRTQGGNNNAYCQDNEISWYDYSLIAEYEDLHRFVKLLAAFRAAHPAFLRPEFFTGIDTSFNAIPDITWFDEEGNQMNWSRNRNILAYRVDGSKAEILADRDDNDFYLMFNASAADVAFTVCAPPVGTRWHRVIDTARESPTDFLEAGAEEPVEETNGYTVRARSTVVLLSR